MAGTKSFGLDMSCLLLIILLFSVSVRLLVGQRQPPPQRLGQKIGGAGTTSVNSSLAFKTGQADKHLGEHHPVRTALIIPTLCGQRQGRRIPPVAVALH